MEFIAEARRPVLVQRHRGLVEEMESSLSDAFIDGSTDNPRLKAILAELDSDSEKARVERTIQTLADDQHYKDAILRDALIEELCLLRERGSVEIATLQQHVMGVYRQVKRRIEACQHTPALIAELRPLPVAMLSRVLNPLAPAFGSPRLGDSLVYTPDRAEAVIASSKRRHKAVGGDPHWQDADGDPSLPREIEEPIEKLPETERRLARQLAVRDRVRSAFYRAVFLEYFSVDTLDPRDVEAYPTILSWLETIESTPHLFPFMQGQTPAQKFFRLGQLQQKLIQLHEMYARLLRARDQPELKAQFEGKSVREQLQVMAKAHYPPLPLNNDMALAVLLCPFPSFVAWLQEKVGSKDFILPPDPRR
jgi:hypothetical protein